MSAATWGRASRGSSDEFYDLRVVPSDEAREAVGYYKDQGLHLAADLAHTAAVLGEQVAAVKALHKDDGYGGCSHTPDNLIDP